MGTYNEKGQVTLKKIVKLVDVLGIKIILGGHIGRNVVQT